MQTIETFDIGNKFETFDPLVCTQQIKVGGTYKI